jgi:hypothetical protein
MRLAVMGLATVIALLALGVPSSDAQFFSKRFCTYGGGPGSSGEPDCSYNTWEQCRASASGLGRYCGENPNYAGSRGSDQQQSTATRKAKRKSNREQ